MAQYRRIPEVVDAKRVDSHGWVLTKDDGTSERVPEFIFLQKYELIPEIKVAVSKTSQSVNYVVIQFVGSTPTRRLMSLDMVRRWDTETGWEPLSPPCSMIVSDGGTFLVPNANWLIFRGKSFLFHCDDDYFWNHFNIVEE